MTFRETTSPSKDTLTPSPILAAQELDADLLHAIPIHERQRIVSGMRWTVWLAVLGAPFGYVTSLILARASPEALGTYGLLLVYIQLVQTWLYLGGDAVVITFLPRLRQSDKLSFLCSYFLIILAALVPWWIAGSLWPRTLHYVFGNRDSKQVQLLILYLSPICIAFCFLLATLKARLEMKWAQGLFRFVTFGSLLAYGTMFVTARHLLVAFYSEIIWAVYFGFVGLATTIAFWKLWRLAAGRLNWRAVRYFLPNGFWRYLLPLQISSAISMAAGSIDYLLVLNFGGLTTLGRYLAIAMISDLMRVLNNVLLDTLLPALTNLLATDNAKGATQFFRVTLRIVFAANAALGCALILLVHPILRVLGPQYAELGTPMILLTSFATLAAPGAIGGTLLSAVGKQHRATWLSLARLGLSAGLFLILWRPYGLLGAVIASGAALLAYCIGLPAAAKFGVPIKFSISMHYIQFAFVIASAAAVSGSIGPFGVGVAAALWLIAMGLFFVVSRYSYAECRNMAQY